MLDHLQAHYALYGEFSGVRTARKHIGWYVRSLPDGEAFRARMNTLDDCASQLRAVADFFDALAVHTDRMPSRSADAELPTDEEAAIAAG
jgi:tRNA-dihydrouridine synthase B